MRRAFLLALRIAATLAWLAWVTLTIFFPQTVPERDADAVLNVGLSGTTASAAALREGGSGE